MGGTTTAGPLELGGSARARRRDPALDAGHRNSMPVREPDGVGRRGGRDRRRDRNRRGDSRRRGHGSRRRHGPGRSHLGGRWSGNGRAAGVISTAAVTGAAAATPPPLSRAGRRRWPAPRRARCGRRGVGATPTPKAPRRWARTVGAVGRCRRRPGTVLAVPGTPAAGLGGPAAFNDPGASASPDTPGATPLNPRMSDEPPRPESRRGDSETVPDKGSTSTPSWRSSRCPGARCGPATVWRGLPPPATTTPTLAASTTTRARVAAPHWRRVRRRPGRGRHGARRGDIGRRRHRGGPPGQRAAQVVLETVTWVDVHRSSPGSAIAPRRRAQPRCTSEATVPGRQCSSAAISLSLICS